MLDLVIETPPPPLIATNVHSLAIPADWKRSFSNLELSSFSLVNFLIRRLISPKNPITLFLINMEHSLEDINVLYNYMDLVIKGRKYKMWLIFHWDFSFPQKTDR